MVGSSCVSKRNLFFLGFGSREAQRVSVEWTVGLLGGPGAGAWKHGKGVGRCSVLSISTWGCSKAIFSPCVSQHLKCLAPQNPPATPLPWTGGHWESLPTSCSELGYVCGSALGHAAGRVNALEQR